VPKALRQISEELIAIRPIFIIQRWEPEQRQIQWTWNDEYRHQWSSDIDRTRDILEQVKLHGISFADHVAPIQLGNDGYVWNGHHRIVAALYLAIEEVMVDMVPKEWKRS
jgi:hypothetical protein